MISPPVARASIGGRALLRGRVARGLLAAAAACGSPPRADGVAVVASGADLESGNPLVTVHPMARQVQRHALFVTLVRLDARLAVQPYLARRWEWADARRTLTLVLAPTLHWHDGRRLTAGDVVFTLEATRDPATGSPRAGDLALVHEARALDDTTVVLRFAVAQPDVPNVLAELPIVPAHLLSRVPRAAMREHAFATAPVGSGPFRFVRRDAGQRWVFAANPDFPRVLGGPPALRGFVVAVVDEATTKFAALASGEVDLAGISPTMAALAAGDPALRVATYPVLFTTALVFNPHRPPFDDVRVRRAASLTLDRARIVDVAVAGFARPAGGPLPPENPLAYHLPPEHLPSVADSLLDAAGWRRGSDGARRKGNRPLAAELLTVGSGDNAVEQLVQADLAARGFAIEIRQLEMGAFLARARGAGRAWDLLYTGIPGDLGAGQLAAMFDSRQAGGALDYAGFHTARLDTLFARTGSAADASGRRAAWHAVQQELARELPVTWVYHARGVQGVSRRLRNVTMDLRGELPTIARWTLADPGA